MENATIKEPYTHSPMGYIGLPVSVDFSSLPETISLSGKILTKKKSFHVTLLYTKNVFSLVSLKKPIDDRAVENKLLTIFNEYIQNHPIIFKELKKEFRLATFGENQAIVVLCEVENLKGFFNECRKEFGIDIPYQPTHITLYVTGNGLGISSDEAMDRCTKIDLPELSSISL